MTQPSPAGGFGGAVSPQRGPGGFFLYKCMHLFMHVCLHAVDVCGFK